MKKPNRDQMTIEQARAAGVLPPVRSEATGVKYKGEDLEQFRSISWFYRTYPQFRGVLYGNATANIFTSQGIGKKKIPRKMHLALKERGLVSSTFGELIGKVFARAKLRSPIPQLDKDAEGAKFYQLNRTKELGAKSSWPDIQIATMRSLSYHAGAEEFNRERFGGLFIELKDPKAGNVPFGKNGFGDFTTNEHIQKQGIQLHQLSEQGYLGLFATGSEEFEIIVRMYMGESTREDLSQTYIEKQEFRDRFEKKDRWFYRLRRI